MTETTRGKINGGRLCSMNSTEASPSCTSQLAPLNDGSQNVPSQRSVQFEHPNDISTSDATTFTGTDQSSFPANRLLKSKITERCLGFRDQCLNTIATKNSLNLIKSPTQYDIPSGKRHGVVIFPSQQFSRQASHNDDEIYDSNAGHNSQGRQDLDGLLNQLLADRISVMSRESRSVSRSSSRTFSILLFAECFIILASFIVSLTWSLIKRDVQGGFTIGAYIIGVGTLLVAGIKAHVENSMKRTRLNDIEL